MSKRNQSNNKQIKDNIWRNILGDNVGTPAHRCPGGCGQPPLQRQSAITLIALIITIIVMLILAGVTLALVLSGGLFGQANKASFLSQIKAAQEQAYIYVADNAIAEAENYIEATKTINTGIENLKTLKYDEDIEEIEDAFEYSELIKNILTNTPKEITNQSIIHKRRILLHMEKNSRRQTKSTMVHRSRSKNMGI